MKCLFILSLIHIIYASSTFVGLIILFSLHHNESVEFWYRYGHDRSDARSVFNPAVVLSAWSFLFVFAIWDYCALGAIISSTEHRNHGGALRRPYSRFWCCRSATINERLTDSCHGYCDQSTCRVLIIAWRMAMVSAMISISGMTIWQGEYHEHGNKVRVDSLMYALATVVLILSLIELPLSIAGSICHSIYTYHWIRNWHRIEIMAMEFSIRDDSGDSLSRDFDD